MKVTRAYKLRIYANSQKEDTARYCYVKFNEYVNFWLGRLFFNGNKTMSTEGLGNLSNQAQHKARSIVKAQLASKEATGNKINVPVVSSCGVPVKYEKSKSKHFDYFVSVSNQWEKKKLVKLPVKSHKALNIALKNGWGLTNFGELKFINGKPFLIVFVQKEVGKASPKEECLGCDVGINKSVSRSDGHKGTNLGKVIRRFKEQQAERNRQRTKFGQNIPKSKKDKTYLKQLIDIEAQKAVRRSKELNVSLVVESRKVLNNLRSGKLSLWARSYFANRCEILCKENEVFLLEVIPAYTSLKCNVCGELGDRQSEKFTCKNPSCCEHDISVDADINAAKAIRNKGQRIILEKIIPKIRSGRCKKSVSERDANAA